MRKLILGAVAAVAFAGPALAYDVGASADTSPEAITGPAHRHAYRDSYAYDAPHYWNERHRIVQNPHLRQTDNPNSYGRPDRP